ncbi:MAG TPA: tyrosine-type recombinase/integrase [Solirubrobacteraceae bacterium]|jgi:integrase|nr:tyrosine-type recombinase/integrase [Solirubrobacteraceae bacterium]
MSTGIEARHARGCPQNRRNGREGRCDCTPTYQAQVWDAKAQKRIRRTFPTKTGAKQWRHDAITAVRAGDLSGERGPTLKEASDSWLAGIRDGTITNRSGDPYKPQARRDYDRILRVRILPALGHMRLTEVTTRDVQALVDDLVSKGAAPATVDTVTTPLKALYRRAVARGDVRANPTVGIEKPGVRSAPRSVVSPEQAAAMIAVLSGADRVLWACAFYTGMRRGELTALRRENVDLATGLIHVRHGWDAQEGEIAPKSRKGRRKIPVVAVLRDHLDQHLLTHDRERVFESQSWIAYAAMRAREAWEAVGLPVVTLHECRHTFASFAIASGMNAKTVCTIMGHADIATTYDLYGHLLPGSEDEAATRLDAFFEQADATTVAQTVAHPAKMAT